MKNSYKNTLLSLFLLFIFVHTSGCPEPEKKKIKAKPANLSSNINNEKPENLWSNINNEKPENLWSNINNEKPENLWSNINNEIKQNQNNQPETQNNQQPQQNKKQPQQNKKQPQQNNQQSQQNNQQSQQNNQQSQQNNQKMTEKELNDRLKNIVRYKDNSGVTYINNYIDDFISNLKNIEDKFIIEQLYKAKEDEYNNSNSQNIHKYNHIATYNTNYKKHSIKLSKFLTEDLSLLQKEKFLDILCNPDNKHNVLGLLDNLAQDTKNNSKTLNLDNTQIHKILSLTLQFNKDVIANAIKYISSIKIKTNILKTILNKIQNQRNNVSSKDRESIKARIKYITDNNKDSIKYYERAINGLK